jgi:hypothetical protein
MKKKFYTILKVILIAMLATTPVFARGNISLSGGWGSGSIHFDGFAKGVGGYDGITLELIGFGEPEVKCTNQGGNEASGQNPASIAVDGYTYVDEGQIDSTTKKGKTPVGVVADEDNLEITGTEGGCPNDNWSATIISIEWFGAVINVYNGDSTDSADLVKTFNYTCDPTLKNGNTLSCTLVSTTTH